MSSRMCKYCIWFDQCGCETPCEDYYPISDEERDEDAEKEYILDLRNRQALYMNQVAEQDE